MPTNEGTNRDKTEKGRQKSDHGQTNIYIYNSHEASANIKTTYLEWGWIVDNGSNDMQENEENVWCGWKEEWETSWVEMMEIRVKSLYWLFWAIKQTPAVGFFLLSK